MSSDSDGEEHSAIGALLGGSWELTQKILQTLSFREVANCRRVCRTWSAVGDKILEKRRRLHFLTIHPYSVPTTEGKVNMVEAEETPSQIIDAFFNHLVSKPHYCIGFCNEKWLTRTDIFKNGNSKGIMLCEYLESSLGCDYCLVCADGIVGTVEHSYQGHWLDDNKSLNNSIMDFINFDNHDDSADNIMKNNNGQQNDSSGTDENNSNDENIEEYANSTCSYGSKRKLEKSVGYSIEVESQSISTIVEADALTLLLIPKHPGVKITFFYVEEDRFIQKYPNCSHSMSRTTCIEYIINEYTYIMTVATIQKLKNLILYQIASKSSF
ncbi:unnamed protein product, partial [Meganyctiphanes norvegica]